MRVEKAWGSHVSKKIIYDYLLAFMLRETVTISDGSRILLCPLGPKNDLKTMIYFGAFFKKSFLFLLGALGAIVIWCHRGAIRSDNLGTSGHTQEKKGTNS